MHSETFNVPGALIPSEVVKSIMSEMRSISGRYAAEKIPQLEEDVRSATSIPVDPFDTEQRDNAIRWAEGYLEDGRQLAREGAPIMLNSLRIQTKKSSYSWEGESEDLSDLDRLDDASGDDAVVVAFRSGWGYQDERQEVSLSRWDSSVHVEVKNPLRTPSQLAARIETLLQGTVTPEALQALKLSKKIFVGHGGDKKWEVIERLLREAGYAVEAFESQDRTGSGTFNTVHQMISTSRIAVIVMTAADSLADGSKQARQNVVHEIGLAQGILGAQDTIIVREKSAEEFSNIRGINQIWAPDGDLHAIGEELLAAVKIRFESK